MNKLIVIAGNHQETIDYVVGECRHPNERGIFLIYGAASHNTLRGMQIDKGDEVVFTGTWYERDDIHELRHILHKQGWAGDELDDALRPMRDFIDNWDNWIPARGLELKDVAIEHFKMTEALLGMKGRE